MDEIFWGQTKLPQALNQIADLNDDQFQIVRREVSGAQGFNRSPARCERLASRLDASLSAEDIFNVLGALAMLYEHSRSWENAGADPQAELHELLQLIDWSSSSLAKEPDDLGYRRILDLISKNPILERRNEIQWLQTGIIGTVVDVSSLIELRPRFSEDLSRIEELIPVVIFRVAVEADYGPEKEHIFQFTANLEYLPNVVNEYMTQWHFDDGQVTTTQIFPSKSDGKQSLEVSHRFSKGGNYEVTLHILVKNVSVAQQTCKVLVNPRAGRWERLQSSARLTDQQMTIISGLLAVGSGFLTLYLGSASWGTPTNYLAALLWGSVTSEGLKYAADLVNRSWQPAQ